MTDENIKEALKTVKRYLLDNECYSGHFERYPYNTEFSFESHPSAWRELSRLIVEEGYTAKDVYETLNYQVKDVAPWNFVSFEMHEDDYKLFIMLKNAYKLFVDTLLKLSKEGNE